jgi:hypothetical protein
VHDGVSCEDRHSGPEVLRVDALNGARHTVTLDDRGTIERGKLADLVLVDGDPTIRVEDVRRTSLVFKGRIPMNLAIDSSPTAPVFPIQTRHRFRSASAAPPYPCSPTTNAELSMAAIERRLRRTHERRGGQLVFRAQEFLPCPPPSSLKPAPSISAICR